ncbi:MAG TPA: ABC transporter permease [Isosphaeraceae bacterium]|nr:ABC transporter permease [Isosphaeraceae bacterium]
MWTFAWRNLLTRPLRTALALVGLSIPILGVLGLFSLSNGLRNLVGDTLGKIQGVMVVRENAPTPVFSTLPAGLAKTLRALPHVRDVAPEVLQVAPEIEGRGVIQKLSALAGGGRKAAQSLLDQPIIQGQDIPAHANLRSAVFPSHLLPPDKGGGRFLRTIDEGRPHIVVSKKIAEMYRNKDGRAKKVGDSLLIAGKPFEIIGIYRTNSMFLDVMIIMDITTARRLLGISDDTVSSFYVEATDPGKVEQVSAAIEQAVKEPRVDARTMGEFTANFGRIWGQFDTILMMAVSLALVVGVVGIINTMLMSTTERFTEFGVLRTNGWSKSNVLTLVTVESAALGLLAGLIGCLLATSGTALANPFIGEGLKLSITPEMLGMGLALSVVMGTLGGLYPAWRAAGLVPMDAIRQGAR